MAEPKQLVLGLPLCLYIPSIAAEERGLATAPTFPNLKQCFRGRVLPFPGSLDLLRDRANAMRCSGTLMQMSTA